MKAMRNWLLGVVLLVVGGSTVTAYADWKPSIEMTGRFIATRDDFDETNVVSSLTVEASGRVKFSPAFWTKRKQRSFVFHLKPETVDGKELYVARTKDRECPFTALALRFLPGRSAWLLVGGATTKSPQMELESRAFLEPKVIDDYGWLLSRSFHRQVKGKSRASIAEKDLVGLFHNMAGEFRTSGLYLSTNSLAMAISPVLSLPGRWKLLRADGVAFVAFSMVEVVVEELEASEDSDEVEESRGYGCMLYEVNASCRAVRAVGMGQSTLSEKDARAKALAMWRTKSMPKEKLDDVLPRLSYKPQPERDVRINAILLMK